MIIKKEQKFYNNERKNNNLKKQPGLFDKIPGPGILKKNAIKISIATTVFSSFVINKTNAQFTFRNTALAVAGGVSCYLKPWFEWPAEKINNLESNSALVSDKTFSRENKESEKEKNDKDNQILSNSRLKEQKWLEDHLKVLNQEEKVVAEKLSFWKLSLQSLKDKIPSGDASEIFNSNLITPIFNILISYLLSRKNKNIKDQKERIVNNIEVLAGLLARNEIITTDFLLTHESTDRLQIIIDKFNILIKQNLELKEENLENSAELEKVTNNFNELKAAWESQERKSNILNSESKTSLLEITTEKWEPENRSIMTKNKLEKPKKNERKLKKRLKKVERRLSNTRKCSKQFKSELEKEREKNEELWEKLNDFDDYNVNELQAELDQTKIRLATANDLKSQLTNQYKLQEQTNSKHEREIKNLSRQLFQTREQKNKLETKLESQKEQFQKQPTKERVSPVETIWDKGILMIIVLMVTFIVSLTKINWKNLKKTLSILGHVK